MKHLNRSISNFFAIVATFSLVCVFAFAAAGARAEEAQPEAQWADAGQWASAESAAARVDNRTSFGGRLVHGTVALGDPDGGAASDWDTAAAATPDGWHERTANSTTDPATGATVEAFTQSVSLAVLNKDQVTIEEGRLTAAATIWNAQAVHLLRHNVVIPSGCKLTITGGSIIKFTEGTSLIVEAGGQLIFNDSAANPIHLARAEDDSTDAGGDTDMRPSSDPAANAPWAIQAVSGSFTENGYVTTDGSVTLPYSVSITINDAQALESDGMACVSVTFTGTRTLPFSVDWEAVPGSATLGGDYMLAGGTLAWSGTADGARHIEIPLVVDDVAEPTKTFTVRIVRVRGANVARAAATVTIVDSAQTWAGGEWGVSAESVPVRVDNRTSFGGRLVSGTVTLGDPDGGAPVVWDTATAATPDAWYPRTANSTTDAATGATVAAFEQSVPLAVLNNNKPDAPDAPRVTIEEGRLTATATTWSNDTVHLLRHNVIIPSGYRLTVEGGSVIKFTEGTSLIAESGGQIVFNDSADAPIRLARAEDDGADVGGDTDMRPSTDAAANAPWAIQAISGSFTDHGHVITDGTIPQPSPVSISINDVQVVESDGKVFVSVTFTGTRTLPFSIDWEAVPGTATFGDDYMLNGGTLTWSGTAEGAKYIEIPLVADAVQEGEETFTVRIVRVRGANVARAAATVTIVDTVESWAAGTWASCESDSTVRVDNRTSFGGRLVHGTVTLGDPDGGAPVEWDTTAAPDAWYPRTANSTTDAATGATVAAFEQSVPLAVLNNNKPDVPDAPAAPRVTIEEGRLAVAATTWGNDTVHLLRHSVVIPSGCRLTVEGGSIIKFTEGTNIIVETGGQLVFNDSADAPIRLARAEDDGADVGGDTDMRPSTDDAAKAPWAIQAISGSFTEHGYVVTDGTITQPSTVSITLNDTQVIESDGKAFVSVTFSGTRTLPFSIDWEAVPGTATLGDDYTLASGRLEWSGTSVGAKNIEIPLVVDGDVEPTETFTVRIVRVRGANVVKAAATVTIIDSTQQWANGEWGTSLESAPARVDTRESFGGRLVSGTVTLCDPDGGAPVVWDTATAATPDAWYPRTANSTTDAATGATVAAFEQSVSLAVLNNNKPDAPGAPRVTIEEGRLAANTTWTPDTVHLLRHSVVIPDGCTLTINGGAIVKFTEGTSLVVEDGGRLIFDDKFEAPIHLAYAENDGADVGGDTDMRASGDPAAAAPWAIQAVNRQSAATTVTEHGYVNANGGAMTFSNYISFTVNDAQVVRHSGMAYLPVTLSGTRSTAFSFDWEVVPSTATLGPDYTISSGTLAWTSSSQGTQYIPIPIATAPSGEPQKTFTVRIVRTRGINAARAAATVSLFDSAVAVGAEGWASAETANTRVDLREGTGGRLVRGIQPIGTPDGSGAQDWDTRPLDDGWHAVSRGGESRDLLSLNSAKIAIEDGRLAASATWTSNVVHVVRHTVVVPSGVTLTIADGAIVKFTEESGILVETGGRLVVNGAVLTHIADDSAGGDTNADGNRTSPTHDAYSITGTGSITYAATCDLRYKSVSNLTAGTLAASEVWPGNRIYRITGVLTIPSGKSLTIGEGAILKFGPDTGAGINVASGGALNIAGSAARKVVLTSIKDDSHGGDTNGDRANSLPNLGDWRGITNSGGTVSIQHARIHYSGAGAFNNQGFAALRNESGTLTLRDSELYASMQAHVNRAGGTVTLENCVLDDARRAVEGAATLTNCVIYACQTSLTAGVARNCIIAESGAPTATLDHCILWESERASDGAGFIVADPLFTDEENGDFTLRPGSPAIDAANSAVAPPLDYFGMPRVNAPYAAPTGAPDENGVFADIGAFEFAAENARSDIDLAATAVSGPASVSGGETVTITWRVANVGTKTATGHRADTVSLTSVDPALGARSVSLGEHLVFDTLLPGESREYSATVRVPSVQSGLWAWSVTANSNRGVAEGSLYSNNTFVSTATLRITTETLPAGYNTLVLGGGESATYALGADIGREGAIVVLSSADIAGFVGAGYAPASGHYDYRVQDIGDGNHLIIIPPRSSPTDFFLLLQNPGGASLPVAVDVLPLEFKLYGIGTKAISNTGVFKIAMRGTRLNEAATARIVLNARSYNAVSLEHISDTELLATFEVSNIPGGSYNVEIADASARVSHLLGALNVIPNATFDQKNFYARIEMPETTRPGREAVAYFIYGNNGKTALPAPRVLLMPGQLIGGGWEGGRRANPPVVIARMAAANTAAATPANTAAAASVPAPGVAALNVIVPLDTSKYEPDKDLYLRLSPNEAWQNSSFEIFATSATHPVSMLKPGEERRIPIFYKETNSLATVLYLSWKAAYEPNASAFPWDANASYMRPAWANDEVWAYILGNLRATIGNTWDDYFNKMRSNLDYLASRGDATNRAGAAWQMEVNNAIAPNGQPAVLASGMDIGVAVRGGAIGINRIYASSLRNRFTQGIFGYGWTHGYDYSLQLGESSKRLYIHSAALGSLIYTYEKTANGFPAWEPADKSNKVSLVETAAEYVLTDRMKNVIRLAKTDGRILAATDNAGNATTFDYIEGRLAAVRHSDSRHLLLTYASGLVSKITDDQGRSVSYTYSGGHLATATDDTSGNTIRYTYSTASGVRRHALTQIRRPDGTTTDFLFDTLGRVAAISQNGNQQTTSINYESSSVVSYVDAAGALTRTWFGASGRPLASQDALGGVTRFNYDAERGLLLSATLPNGTTTRIEYDAEGNPSATISPTGKITRYSSDSRGLLTSFTDARGNTVRYTHDTRGNTLSIVHPDATARTFTYDDKSQLTAATNRRGQNVTLDYDTHGRVVKRTYPDGREFTYTYNTRNQMLTATDTHTGTIAFTYDEKDRLAAIAYPNGKSFAYHYDSIGRLTRRVSEDAFELRYSYTADGNLLAVTDKEGREYVRYGFDTETGRLATTRLGNSTKTTYGYDIAGRVTTIAHATPGGAPLETFAYAYDANYDISGMTNSKGLTAYQYDGEHQLTRVTRHDGANDEYTYDTVGNRTKAGSETYAVNALNQYTQVGELAFRHDADGNLIRKGETAYEYDPENRLVRLTRPDASVWSCKYDALGNRVEVTDRGVTKRFVFDPQGIGELSAEYNSSGVLLRRYIHSGMLVADESPSGERRYYHADLQGSTRLLTNGSGAIIRSFDYTAWGKEIETSEGAGGDTTMFRYVGAYGVMDDDTGLLFMKNRYYDFDTGRFIQEDPIGPFGGDVNWYRYCGNNGISFTDALGLGMDGVNPFGGGNRIYPVSPPSNVGPYSNNPASNSTYSGTQLSSCPESEALEAAGRFKQAQVKRVGGMAAGGVLWWDAFSSKEPFSRGRLAEAMLGGAIAGGSAGAFYGAAGGFFVLPIVGPVMGAGTLGAIGAVGGAVVGGVTYWAAHR